MPQKTITTNIKDFFLFKKLNERLLSIDYGRKKLGIAITNETETMALPLKVHLYKTSQNLDSSFSLKQKTIEEYIRGYKIWGLIIGLPINMDGSESNSSLEVRRFAEFISPHIGLPIFLQDERLTSMAADSLLKEAGFSRKERNARDDMIAAAMIAETVIDSVKRSIPED